MVQFLPEDLHFLDGKMSNISIKISNFQSHRLTEISTNKNFVSLVGANNVGKTALIRSLYWILEDIRGDDFIRDGCKQASVVLQIDDKVVERKKGNKENSYRLDGVEYKSIGYRPPMEVLRGLDLLPLKLDNDNEVQLSLTDQLEEHFLIFKPGSYKGKFLGSLTGANKLDAALKDTNNRLASTKKNIDVVKQSIASIETQLVGYANLPVVQQQIDELVDLDKVIGDLQVKLNKLREEKFRISDVSTKLDGIRSKIISIKEGLTKCQITDEQVSLWSSYCNELERLYRAKYDWCDLGDGIDVLTHKIHNRLVEKESVTMDIKNKIQEYTEALKSIGACPYCLQPVTQATLDECLKEIVA